MGSGRLLAVRADGGRGVGSGHLARCLALVQAWRDDGGEAVLLTGDGGGWADRYKQAGAAVLGPPALAALDPAWVVVDGYSFGPQECLAARAVGARVLVVDDHGLGKAAPADSLLDQGLGASADRYRGRVDSAALLLGPRFALLRPEFAAARPMAEARRAPPRAHRVLLSLGGHPPALVVQLFERIHRALSVDHDVRWLAGASDVSVEMLWADMAVAAAGSTCWELCSLGLPAALVSTARNQRAVADALGRVGIAVDLGSQQLEPTVALAAIRALSADPARRAAMTEAGMSLVDGRGARRVVAHLRGQLLDLRLVAASDAGLLWRWANDEATRAASFITEWIPWAEHEQWLQRKLSDPTCAMFLVEAPGSGPVGQVRFNQRGRRAEIAFSVSPEHRRRGLGPAVIDAGVRAFLRGRPGVIVDAFVKPGNLASARSFDAAGFVTSGIDGDGERLHYVHTLDGSART